ncbi:MAG: hypothetical protein ACTSVO_00790 [Candidatus Heimdallarchaeaceae archaeon]
MKVEIKRRKLQEVEYFFPERKMFTWGQIIGTGALATFSIWLTVFLSSLPEAGEIQDAATTALKVVFIVFDVIILLMFLIEIIPYKYIIKTLQDEAQKAVKEELKEQVKELPNDLLILMREQIEEELLTRKENERMEEKESRINEELRRLVMMRKKLEEEKEEERKIQSDE